jgi:Hsp20/alpha crystallin family
MLILFRYRIPEGLTHDDVTSDLSADGVLVVKAHKAQAA